MQVLSGEGFKSATLDMPPADNVDVPEQAEPAPHNNQSEANTTRPFDPVRNT